MDLQKILKAFTLYWQKHSKYLMIGFLTLLISNSYSQMIVKEFKKDSLSNYLQNAKSPINKIIPTEYEGVIRLALLYYPELDKTKIIFRTKRQISPLTARPSILAVFCSASQRKYIITISNKNDSKFSNIFLKNLSINSQIGVIGHELSHISHYNRRYGMYFIKLLFMHVSEKAMDKFEYNTDMLCIEHGLGYQLLSWSKEVRLKLNIIQWRGASHFNENGGERYMNPESILKVINLNKIYF